MQTGELVVSVSGQVVIPLNKFPSEVKVHFKAQNVESAPCNPQHVDTLTFEVVVDAASSYALVINWSVSSVREIVWHAYY